jgi:hypothetical protein
MKLQDAFMKVQKIQGEAAASQTGSQQIHVAPWKELCLMHCALQFQSSGTATNDCMNQGIVKSHNLQYIPSSKHV